MIHFKFSGAKFKKLQWLPAWFRTENPLIAAVISTYNKLTKAVFATFFSDGYEGKNFQTAYRIRPRKCLLLSRRGAAGTPHVLVAVRAQRGSSSGALSRPNGINPKFTWGSAESCPFFSGKLCCFSNLREVLGIFFFSNWLLFGRPRLVFYAKRTCHRNRTRISENTLRGDNHLAISSVWFIQILHPGWVYTNGQTMWRKPWRVAVTTSQSIGKWVGAFESVKFEYFGVFFLIELAAI